jgi:hypothetical protein
LFKRWLLPAAFLPVALGAVGFLAVTSLVDEEPEGLLVQREQRSVQPTAPEWDETLSVDVVHAPPTRHVSARARRDPARTSRPQAPRRSSQPTPHTGQAVGLVIQLARAPSLEARLGLLDRAVEGLNDDQAAAVLVGLLDSQVPGDYREAQALRLRALAKLGRLSGMRAEAQLIETTRPETPRPERLMALELLAARMPAGESEIQAIASADHDRVVRDKARWALQRRGTMR